MTTTLTLPELGENITSGDVIQVLVAPGDAIVVDQPVLEIETDKATVEVPSDVGGTVVALAVKAGDKVAIGQVILTVDAPAAGEVAASLPPPAAGTPPPPVPAPVVPDAPAAAVTEPPARSEPIVSPPAPTPASVSRDTAAVLAAPSVRRLAREIGVEIVEVPGTGTSGRVTADDVKTHARRALTAARGTGRDAAPPLPDFTKWGPVERTAIRSVRRATAQRMSRSWRIVPHVTQHDRADVTHFEATRAALKREAPDVKLTATALAVKVAAAALREFPQFNASLDTAREEIVYKRYVHIGVAVDTDRGLLVPVVRDADRKTLRQISSEIPALAEKAREKRLMLDEMAGGTFTITNLGGLGGTAFTPIINHPEVAILGLSRSTREAVFVGQAFEPRLMLPLSLSYDHRLIDGADAVRFLRWVAKRLESPLLLGLDESTNEGSDA